MRQEIHLPSLRDRITSKPNLLMVLLVGGLLGSFRIYLDPTHLNAFELALPFAFLLLHLALAPMPWLWGVQLDGRRTFLPRFIKALGFNAAWVALVVVAMHTFGPHPTPGPHPPRIAPPQVRSAPGLPPGDPGFRPPPERGIPFPQVGFALLNLAFALVFGWELAEKEITEARERRTADLLRQTRFRALQNQLEPHVLYNALNGVAELIHEDPLAAEEVVTQLASLYRMLTDYAKAEVATLGEERQVVEAYLAMEQMRLGERLRAAWDWPEWADRVRVPPLFLQTLVENAIKHGISSREEGGEVHIACLREGPTTLLQVANTGQPPEPGGRQGAGLENLGARLELWMEMESAFSLRREGDWTIARIEWRPRSSA